MSRSLFSVVKVDPLPRHPRVLLAFPRFTKQSFWSLTALCEVSARKWPSPPLGMITVAALLPADWDVRLIDCNVEELTDADILAADMVMTGGMIPQRVDCLDIIARVRALGRPVLVGGPDITSSPDIFSAADFRIIGEAETVMPRFVESWRAGERSGDFEAEKYKTDVTASPMPRYDLLKIDRYLSISVQFSRGCPFTCEFCDIIELFGRVPRAKTAEQVLGELSRIHELGHRGVVDFVDDNLIGNKKAVKAFLPHLIAWQEAHGYPFEFYTEASINLADDAQLLALMKRANFNLVFIGIETPDPDALVQMRKKQNTRRDIADSIALIHKAGIQVHAGFIIGFDQEAAGSAEAMIACIEDSAIPVCMIGLLAALPNTQLSRRLVDEGRLDPERDLDFAAALDENISGDQCSFGLNFRTLRPRRAILVDYRNVLEKVYDTDAFFSRVERMMLRMNIAVLPERFDLRKLKTDLVSVFGIVKWLTVRDRSLIRPFLRTLYRIARQNFPAARIAIAMMTFYFHLGPFAREVIQSLDDEIGQIEPDSGSPEAHARVELAKVS
ncbi:MAG: B12-binding domain-containing radical SAM protein [Rhodobiaceae bacterium]|nr:B12-binding domain-containing radical SAM protein [Rhodobiaceae bacterium]